VVRTNSNSAIVFVQRGHITSPIKKLQTDNAPLGSFSVYISCRLVFSECDKTGVPQVVVRCPLSEFKLSDEHRF
jgi:hypothetical protein